MHYQNTHQKKQRVHIQHTYRHKHYGKLQADIKQHRQKRPP